MNLPRLTGALRAFSSVTVQDDYTGNVVDDIKRKRQLRAKHQAKESIGWDKLTFIIQKHAKVSKDEVTGVIRELNHVAKDIVGSESSPGVLDGAAVFLFHTFLDCDKVGQRQTSEIRALFGPFPASAGTKACTVVAKIISLLPDDVINELKSDFEAKDDNETQEFGSSIKFVARTKESPKDIEFFSSDSDEDVENAMNRLSMKYIETMTTSSQDGNNKGQVDAGWLKREVEKHFNSGEMGLSIMDMCSTIFDFLTSSKSDSELQNDLFELLGFDRFEFIQSLLENRKALISVTLDCATDMMLSSSSSRSQEPTGRPNYGCQVTIQSRQEKDMRKIMKKEKSTDCDSA